MRIKAKVTRIITSKDNKIIFANLPPNLIIKLKLREIKIFVNKEINLKIGNFYYFEGFLKDDIFFTKGNPTEVLDKLKIHLALVRKRILSTNTISFISSFWSKISKLKTIKEINLYLINNDILNKEEIKNLDYLPTKILDDFNWKNSDSEKAKTLEKIKVTLMNIIGTSSLVANQIKELLINTPYKLNFVNEIGERDIFLFLENNRDKISDITKKIVKNTIVSFIISIQNKDSKIVVTHNEILEFLKFIYNGNEEFEFNYHEDNDASEINEILLEIVNEMLSEKVIFEIFPKHFTLLHDFKKISLIKQKLQDSDIEHKVVSGMAGTGKTTKLKEFYEKDLKEYEDEEIIILAPTGKAVSNLLIKSLNAFTIAKKTYHNQILLDKFFLLNQSFGVFKTFDNVKVVFIDEASMISHDELFLIFVTYPNIEKIYYIGDGNQILSIKSYPIFKILLNYVKDIVKLENIYRTDSLSLTNFQIDFLNGKNILFVDPRYADITFIHAIEYDDFWDKMQQTIPKLEKESIFNFQYLMALNNIENGNSKLNNIIQEYLVDKNILKSPNYFGVKRFSIGEKIIANKNLYNLEIKNGQTFEVTKIISNDEIEIIGENNTKHKIDRNNSPYFDLAYSISVHKSQGSEWNNVIIGIPKEHCNFWDKKMFYTAITRAKNKLTIIGDLSKIEKFQNMEENNENDVIYDFFLNQ